MNQINNELYQKMIKTINSSFEKKYIYNVLSNETDVTNFIQKIGRLYDFEDFIEEDNELYHEISIYIKTKLKNKRMSEKIIKEASEYKAPTNTSILRYEDSDALKIIENVLRKEFSDIKIEQINNNEGGNFFTCILVMKLEDNVKNDIERNRFFLHSSINKFKLEFLSSISNLLPIVSMNVGSYLTTKNSSSLKFTVTILLSHTDDREWVSGNYRKIDEEKVEEIINEVIKEGARGRKSLVDAMPLETAIRKYVSKEINLEVLETAIKACGRAELEIFVLKKIGVNISKLNSNTEDNKEDNNNFLN